MIFTVAEIIWLIEHRNELDKDDWRRVWIETFLDYFHRETDKLLKDKGMEI